jgi:carbonic anhydrase
MNGRVSASEALERLKAGNRRFVEGAEGPMRRYGPPDSLSATQPQEPVAIVLGCSDSRVPAEMVFDQGLGDLFVIRVAGNVVAPSQVDSVEFAASQFGTRLVVVLGHTQCGAILATIEEMGREESQRSRSLRSIVDRVRPAIESVLGEGKALEPDTLIEQAVRANIMASVTQLSAGSEGMSELIANHGLRIVGAEYSLETGVVRFLESPDE